MATVSYGEDYAAWALASAELLRNGRVSDLDLEHLAEEMESMGRRSQRELLSRLTILLTYLLKWKAQPALRSSGWKATIRHQRFEIQDLLEESPSLQTNFSETLAKAHGRARLQAAAETGLDEGFFALPCPWSPEQVLTQEFWPDS